MKPCHENNDAAIYAGRAATARNGFILMFTVQLNTLTGTWELVSCSNTFKIYCGLCTFKATNANKNITKKFFRRHNHCFLFTMS